jgi:hypothetical protein
MSVKKVTDLGAPRLGELGLSLVDVRGLQLACGPEEQDRSLKTDREAPGARSRPTPSFSPLRDAGGTCRLWFIQYY